MERLQDDELSLDECWRLLSGASLGRLALSVRALPTIVPVQYHVTAGEIALCLGYHVVPDVSLNDTIVAFAADAIGPDDLGWSVQVQGIANSAGTGSGGERAGCGQPSGGQMLTLVPATVTGHLVRLCPFVPPSR